MKIKLQEIKNSVGSLNNLQDKELPVKTSYRLKRLVDKINPILKSYNEKRIDLVKEFGEENEKKEWNVKPENLEKFQEKFNELIEVEEEIDFEPIKIKDLGNVNIPAKDLISWVFIE